MLAVDRIIFFRTRRTCESWSATAVSQNHESDTLITMRGERDDGTIWLHSRERCVRIGFVATLLP